MFENLCLMFVFVYTYACFMFENLCLMFVFVYTYACFMFVKWLVFQIDLTEGWYKYIYIYVCVCEKSLEMCICLWPEFDCPEVTLCGWQDIKIQLPLLLLLLDAFSGSVLLTSGRLLFLLVLKVRWNCSRSSRSWWKTWIILDAFSGSVLLTSSRLLFLLELNMRRNCSRSSRSSWKTWTILDAFSGSYSAFDF